MNLNPTCVSFLQVNIYDHPFFFFFFFFCILHIIPPLYIKLFQALVKILNLKLY